MAHLEAPELTLILVERFSGKKRRRELWYTPDKQLQIAEKRRPLEYRTTRKVVEEFLTKVFLPVGYPKTVTPDYLQYQILNAAQAFCNSLASLLASRAVLEGIGVGDPSATSTNAMLLSILQDAFGRITTIVGAYYYGTRLVPEAKKYRFLADVLNDIAVVVDVFTPAISSFLPVRGGRALGMCISAALKALCGMIAGGSKAAITLHFATPSSGLGDIGDLNAKDSSKETVLALAGMLLGGLIVPHITSTWATYSLLLVLIFFHLAINYIGVRGLAIRTLNQQRAAILWLRYHATMSSNNKTVLTPLEVAQHELILERPGIIRDPTTHRIIGECHIGSAPLDVMRGSALSRDFLEIFMAERFIVCFDPRNSPLTNKNIRDPSFRPILHVCFREDYTPEDVLKGWFHAVEICRVLALKEVSANLVDSEDRLGNALIESTYKDTRERYAGLGDQLKKSGWNLSEYYLVPANFEPKACLYAVAETSERKMRP